MKELTERLNHCIPYLRVATLVSRETIYDLMMQTDLDTVYTMLAVMHIGRVAYTDPFPRNRISPHLLLGDALTVMPVYAPPSMSKELNDMLSLKDFRKYIICGIQTLGIY